MSSRSIMALLSLGRLRFCAVTLDKATNRASYSIGLSVNRPPGKKNLPSRNSRGAGGRKPRLEVGEPRTQKMPVDQDWTAVYPAATSFRATSVPLPLRMGYPVKGGVPPDKTGNLELIKIPNFLHLTPIAIRKHCEALKAFCTQWPSSLDTEEACDEHFPIKVESTDYVSAGLSVRNPAARVVHLRVKLSSLNLDDHARKKMLKLVGERYCKKKDILAITTDSCPLRQQNYDYAMYLLTVLYHESWKTESWEGEKTVADMEEYSWEDSPSQKNIVDLLLRMEAAGEEEEDKVRERLLERSDVQEYKDSVVRLKNEGDSESNMLQYKEAVKKVFSL
ncbi:small ribosomal subunit protein mS35 [Gouania willdenowi]|uniref:Small ribosomal subunit protein mS35 mitochondrial conserved domain-containing protein n=1 Tax=Gouania willdenowi TaxID=441366 RepID=A0A8C5GK44_GOUWI|nr:28S ribosomal protein S35, mitochondrial [Gouania willdenowi]